MAARGDRRRRGHACLAQRAGERGSIPLSASAAARRTASADTPSAGSTSTTRGAPSVSVPVLSNRMRRTPASASSAAALRNRIP